MTRRITETLVSPSPVEIAVLWRESWRYLVVSGVALGADFTCLVGLTELAHVYYLWSAAVGFVVGTVVNYALSVAFVFRNRRIANRLFEFAVFVGVGVIGLAVNEGLMKLFVDGVGLGYVIAKVPSATGDFIVNFAIRKALLFTAPRRPASKTTDMAKMNPQ